MKGRGLLTVAALAIAMSVPATAHAVSFSQPIYVDKELAGGEPLVATDGVHKTLVYTSHEGTTHLYQPGYFSPLPFGVNYRNQVNIWTSDDDGVTWQRTGTAGFSADPTKSSGFSDPDLTVDEGGRIYNTGIDLVNDSIFSSVDGGKTYDRGNPNCHNGDRPWLAGGKKAEVFLATNTAENTLSHQIFQSTDGGNTCSATGVPDTGTTPDGQLDYTGAGKIYYSHRSGRLIEPVVYTKHSGGDGSVVGLGVGTWNRGDAAFKATKAVDTSMYAHWPAIALDAADNVYMVYDDNPKQAGTKTGCDGGEGPAPNSIKMVVSKDFGAHWSDPVTIAHPGNGRVFWPWIVAGDTGKVSVVWYQSDKVADLDCETADISIFESHILDATSANPTLDTKNAVGRPIHSKSSVCQGGTTCVAEAKDRRLGDFFTNGLDNRGCVLIASGDTTQTDPATGQPYAVSLPIFVRQTAGKPLVGDGDCKSSAIPSASGRGQCRDRRAPVSHLRRRNAHGTRRRVRAHGRSRDAGCRATATAAARRGRVQRVYVSVAKVRGRHGCRFVNRRGRLERLRNCRRPTLLPARGTTSWRFSIKAHLPPGWYRVVARGLDASSNKEKPRPRNQVRIRIR